MGGFPQAYRSSFDYCWAKTASFFVHFVCENCFKFEYELGSDDLVNCVHKRSNFCLAILLKREGPEDFTSRQNLMNAFSPESGIHFQPLHRVAGQIDYDVHSVLGPMAPNILSKALHYQN
jgi:hypothetical protein